MCVYFKIYFRCQLSVCFIFQLVKNKTIIMVSLPFFSSVVSLFALFLLLFLFSLALLYFTPYTRTKSIFILYWCDSFEIFFLFARFQNETKQEACMTLTLLMLDPFVCMLLLFILRVYCELAIRHVQYVCL